MRTTVELDDELAREAKVLAAELQTTLRSLIEEGLRAELERRRALDRAPAWRPRVHGSGGIDPAWDGIPLHLAAYAETPDEARQLLDGRDGPE